MADETKQTRTRGQHVKTVELSESSTLSIRLTGNVFDLNKEAPCAHRRPG